jgi:hypothetical protein
MWTLVVFAIRNGQLEYFFAEFKDSLSCEWNRPIMHIKYDAVASLCWGQFFV